jgi:hypothetical protein
VICVRFSYDLEMQWKRDCVVQRETEKALPQPLDCFSRRIVLFASLDWTIVTILHPSSSSSSGDCQNGLPGSYSGNTVGKWVVFGFQNSTRLIIGLGSC